jgi:hypothetical protein
VRPLDGSTYRRQISASPELRGLDHIDGLLSFSKAGRRDSVLIGGSLLEGPGNQFSDIDVYVVGASLPSMGKN